MTRTDYRYDECGLDNVILKNLPVRLDDDGEELIVIPAVNLLHNVLLAAVASKPSGLIGKEIRFIRTKLGMTQAELARVIGRDGQTIGRWERNEFEIEQSADTLIRILAFQFLDGESELPDVRELSQRSIQSATQLPYVIDASNPHDYKLVA